ncbi:hypothetical protein D1B31_14865 [Neobacillus notoginsengisoli]|uniref:Uncharacterized protein n=1 Tax=Neobacillus notoginsengisoli TaxID=1578198 RepID=A0A417YS00_9BACI|nr:hypothetical protein [Neobacillus notoginsengisoli]RHW38059.1 hypothetical protein D1B31_14865 [Neobacillus notoginsengisoli]
MSKVNLLKITGCFQQKWGGIAIKLLLSVRTGYRHNVQRHAAGLGYSSFEHSRFCNKMLLEPANGDFDRSHYSYKQIAGIPFKYPIQPL